MELRKIKENQLTENGKQTNRQTSLAHPSLSECCLPPTMNFFTLFSGFIMCFLSTEEKISKWNIFSN